MDCDDFIGRDFYVLFIRLIFFAAALLLVVDAKVAILADSFGIKGAVGVLTFSCQLCAAFGVIAVFAHPVGIVLFTSMSALRYHFSVFLE